MENGFWAWLMNKHFDFGYNSRDIWYQRFSSVEDLIKDLSEGKILPSKNLIKELNFICEYDNDYRVTGKVKSILPDYVDKKRVESSEHKRDLIGRIARSSRPEVLGSPYLKWLVEEDRDNRNEHERKAEQILRDFRYAL